MTEEEEKQLSHDLVLSKKKKIEFVGMSASMNEYASVERHAEVGLLAHSLHRSRCKNTAFLT